MSELGWDLVPMYSPTKLDDDLRNVPTTALMGLSDHIHLIASLRASAKIFHQNTVPT